MESSESRIAPSPEAASDDSAPPINQHPEAAEPAAQASPGCSGAGGGGQYEAADRLAFDPVPLRYREDGLTPEKQRAYVEALADTGVAREAAARVGLTEQAINRVRRRADARSFDNACEAAHLFGARRLRSIAWERAIEGTLKGHYYHGELISQERVHDNRLLIYLLGKTGHLLDPPAESRAICDKWETHMDALEQGLPPPQPRRAEAATPGGMEWTGDEVSEDDEGIWWTIFPPPAGFDGEEQGEFGEDDYKRTLSAQEQALVVAELDEQDAQYRAGEAARRDRFFGFAGGDILSSREAEPYETSEPSDPDPIEYKSLVPPPTPSFRRKPEPMTAQVRRSSRPCSWIPDQVRDDGREPSHSQIASRRGARRRTFPPPRAFPR
jgi:hypothetical protein